MTDSIESGIRQPSSAYLKINALKPPTAQQIAQVMPGSLQAQWLELMFMREQVNLWLQRNATPFTPDDTMRQEVATYLTGVRDELDDDETPPARPDGLQPLHARDLLAQVDWWRRTHGVIAWRVATSRLEGTDYWRLRENRPIRPEYEELLPFAYLHPPFPHIDEPTTTAANHYQTIMAYSPVADSMEGINRFAEQQNIVRVINKPPYVKTHNGSIVSVGALVGAVLDAQEEEEAFAVGRQLSDATVLAFVLGLKRWTSRGDRNDPRSYAVVTVNEYCDARGWARHHKGSHFPKNKATARQEIMALNKVFVRHKVPDYMVTSDGTHFIEGQLMAVSVGTSDKAGLHPTSFRLSPGTWADDYLKDNPGATALLLDRILSIDTSGRTGQIAFRLGLYMALNWRTKYMNNNADQPHVVRKLLAALGIEPAAITRRDERSRMRSYLIAALDLLQSPEIAAIGKRDETGSLVDDWRYANPGAADPDALATWDDWLNWTLHLPAPYEIGTFYKRPQLARQAAKKKGIARGKRRERAIDAARAKHALRGENQ